MILSNQSAPAYLPGSFQAEHNNLPADAFKWADRRGAAPGAASLSESSRRQTAMSNSQAKAARTSPPSRSTLPSQPRLPPPPLFRRIDWLTFLVTFAGVWIGYYLTLAPELTLEDSGELAAGSFYAGIPHPPGYPVWTLYTWLWTVLLPFKNVAWRVALGEATGGALAAGLLGLLVSRGSSLLMEGIEELKEMAGRWEGAICLVSGFVAGMLLGYNGYMWSQSVIVEVYSFSVASFMVVLLCLLRWIYAPHQRRYLYYALFFHGICFTNHQTLIVAAMGIEVAIAAADFRLGRCLFLGNSIIYLAGLILKQQHILTALEQNHAVFVIFNVVGIGSLAAYVWFAVLTKETFAEFCLDARRRGFFCCWQRRRRSGGRPGCWPWWPWGLCQVRPGHPQAGDRMAGGAAVRRGLGAGRRVLFLHAAGRHDQSAHAVGLSAHRRRLHSRLHPRPVRADRSQATSFDHPGVFLMQLMNMGLGIVEEFNWVYVVPGPGAVPVLPQDAPARARVADRHHRHLSLPGRACC